MAFVLVVLALALAFAVYYTTWGRGSKPGMTPLQAPDDAVRPPAPLPAIRSTTAEANRIVLTDVWSLISGKPLDEWMGTRHDRLVRLVRRDNILYVENVSGDDYVERKRGGILLSTVYIVEGAKRSVMVWAADLSVADTIEREVVPACDSPADTGLRGVVASDDAVRRLLTDIRYAEPLPEVD